MLQTPSKIFKLTWKEYISLGEHVIGIRNVAYGRRNLKTFEVFREVLQCHGSCYLEQSVILFSSSSVIIILALRSDRSLIKESKC